MMQSEPERRDNKAMMNVGVVRAMVLLAVFLAAGAPAYAEKADRELAQFIANEPPPLETRPAPRN